MGKKFLEWLKNPHGIPLIIFCITEALFAAAAITLLALCLHDPVGLAFTVICSVFAGVGVLYLVFLLVKCVIRAISRLSERNMFICWILHNFEFQTLIMAVFSFIITVAYAVFEGVLAAISLSAWCATLGVYYVMVAFMRGGVILTRRNGMKLRLSSEQIQRNDVRSYVVSGALLIALTAALAGMLTLITMRGTHFEYAGVMIVIAGVYALYKIASSIVNFIRARKNGALDLQTISNINAADALVSLLALQTAIIQKIKNAGYAFDSVIPNAVTGGVVACLIVAMGIYMIVRGARMLVKIPKSVATETEAPEDREELVLQEAEPAQTEKPEKRREKKKRRNRRKGEQIAEELAPVQEELVLQEGEPVQTEKPEKRREKKKRRNRRKGEQIAEELAPVQEGLVLQEAEPAQVEETEKKRRKKRKAKKEEVIEETAIALDEGEAQEAPEEEVPKKQKKKKRRNRSAEQEECAETDESV